jgi:hypothetical protein
MYPNIVTQILTVVVSILLGAGFSYIITLLIMKISKKLIFIIPILSFLSSAFFWVLAFITDGWGALGYFLYGALLGLFFIGALISSIILWRRNSRRKI